MITLRRLIPTTFRLEASLCRLSTLSTALPSRTTVPLQFVMRPFSLSTTVWKKEVIPKKKELVQKKKVVEEDEDADETGLPKDYKEKTLKTGSRRLDTFVAKSAGVPSSQAEKLVLSGKVRVNEEKTSKKSYNVQKEDVIDIWQEVCEDNNELACAIRVEIKDYEVTNAGYDIHVHVWRKMLVDNWR